MSPRQRSPSLFDSFNYATEGIIHALRTQRNLWIHFTIAAAVLVAAIGFGVSRLELIVLMLAHDSLGKTRHRPHPRHRR